MTVLDTALTTKLFDDGYAGDIDPMALFETWLAEAVESEPNDPNAMALATVGADGMPDNRMVLLNGRDDRGFVFYTNAHSAKGRELEDNSKAALLFHWKSLRRQVRIRGSVHQVSDSESDAYFASRPRGSRIGAHASHQSSPLESREDLLRRVKMLEVKYEGQEVPRPAHWIGYRVMPEQIEFWKDGEFRLHDRVLFRRENPDGAWSRVRLNP